MIRVLPRILARRWPTILAVFVALAAWGLQFTWVVWDQGPPESDEWHHLTKAEVLFQGWARDGPLGVLGQLRYMRSAFPPLVHAGSVPFALITGEFNSEAAEISIGPWIVLLVLCTYGIGRRLLGDGVGLTAACMVAAYPMVISLSHKFLLDLPLAALVAASLWALLRSDGLRKPGWTALSGGLFGLALLAKFIAGVFLLGAYAWLTVPAIWATARRWPLRFGITAVVLGALGGWLAWTGNIWLDEMIQRHPSGKTLVMHWLVLDIPPRLSMAWHLCGVLAIGTLVAAFRVRHDGPRRLLSVGAATLMATWIAGAWYLPHLGEVVLRVGGFSHDGGLGEGDPGPGTVAGWLFYPWALGRAMPRSWFHLLIVGVGLGCLHPRLRKKLAPLLATCALAFLVVNMSHNKELRYAISLVSVMAVFSVGWISVLPRLYRSLLWGTVVAVALMLQLSWIPVATGAWEPPLTTIWLQDRVMSSGRSTFTNFRFPDQVGVSDVLLTPDFYAVAPLPRQMPWDDQDLPFSYIGP